jgi:hypothetical protein
VVIPNEVMTQDCLLTWEGDTWFEGSLVEPLSCVIGAFNANYHLQEGSYNHVMGIRPQGRTLILGGTGPMGLLAIDYALHGPVNPSLLVVTDTNKPKLSYARQHYPSEPQTLIHYLDGHDAGRETLMALSGGHGFDDIFVFVPNEQLITLASSLLAPDGCLNFFAGPQDKQFSAPINFYDVHYAFTHYVGTSGGNTDDMRAAVALMQAKKVQTAKVVTHILGLNAAGETTLDLPAVGGGKKLVYTEKSFPDAAGRIADPSWRRLWRVITGSGPPKRNGICWPTRRILLMINRDTQLCMSLAGRPGNFGTRFHNYLYEKLGLNFIYKAFTTQDIAAAVGGYARWGFAVARSRCRLKRAACLS